MKVYELHPIGYHEDVLPTEPSGWAEFEKLDGTARAEEWAPVAVDLITASDETGEPFAHSDFPWLGAHVLFLRGKAIDLAGPLLSPYGELLPVTCPDATLQVFNTVQVIDALDEKRSELERFPSGRILSIESYVFAPGAIPPRSAFKIPQDLTGPILFTESLVEDLLNLGLEGLSFNQLWDSAEV